jgi:hypothetical protein
MLHLPLHYTSHAPPQPPLLSLPPPHPLLHTVLHCSTRTYLSGGKLYIADRLWDASYGPCDAVLMDGNCLHGITTLCDLPTKGPQPSRPELQRFSLILFSDLFRRENVRSSQWQEGWRPRIPWKPGCAPKPPSRQRGKRKMTATDLEYEYY